MGVETGCLLKLVWGGTLFATETWACSVHLAGLAGGDLPGGTDLTPLEQPLRDWVNRASTGFNGGAALTFVKLNQIARGPVGPNLPGGKQDPAKQTNELIFNPVETGPSGAALPGQLSAVVTLHTDIVRGRASKGRFYPPSTHSISGAVDPIGSDGRMLVNTAKGMADSAQELLSEINALWDVAGPFLDDTGTKCVVGVWSSIAQVFRGAETVSVGRVVDTQRRRRSSLDEDPQTATANI